MPRFSAISKERLSTVDARLQLLFNEVVKGFDCSIIEGRRSKSRQMELYQKRKTKTLNSKHIEGKAVDAAAYPIQWNDRERASYFAGYVKGIAFKMGIGIRWGGDWDNDTEVADNKFDDLVHFELIERKP